MSRVKAGTSPLLTRSYTDGENSTVTSSFANGYTTVVTYDSRGNPIRKTVNGSEVSRAEYDECGNIVSLIDKLKGVCYNYSYDEYGDVIKVEERKTSNNSLVGTQTVTYDDSRRQISRTDSRVSHTYETVYERTLGSVGNILPDNAVRGVTLTGKFTDTVDRDGLRRPSVRKLTLNSASSPLITDTYGYLSRTGGGTTNYVSTLSHKVGSSTSSLSYTYNNNGNITEIRENGTLKYKYTYDSLNRLTREDNYDAGVSYTWTYGCSTKGNLESKTKYLRNSSDTAWVQTAQTDYSYGSSWKDALTSFGSETITYDAIGNPTTYRGKTLTWTNVRRLASFGSNTFQYGADGIRYKKNNITYTLDGNRILKETNGTRTLTYYYGTSGVIGFNYNEADYYYRKNLQGDVIAIYNASGTKVASYVYNAWGEVLKVTNHTSANIGDVNPFRYRSYYYDTETKLYYLETRYYDPEVGRFINSDSIDYLDPETIGGLNLFAYCFNNPVNMSDDTGTWPSWVKKIIAAVAVVACVATVAAVIVATAGAGTAAAVIAIGAAKGAAIGMASGATIGAVTGAIRHRVSTGSWSGAGTAALNGMGDGALSGAVTGAITGAVGSAIKVSQAAKAWDSGTFKSGYQSMKYHYNKHVVSEGLTKANNVLKYTQDAVSFASRNSSVLKYTYNFNYGNASWNLTYSTGQGGMFTSAGKILTFWYR